MPKSKRTFKKCTIWIGPAFKLPIRGSSFPPNPRWGPGWVFHALERKGQKLTIIYERLSV